MGRYYETFYPPFFLDLSFLHDNIADNPNGFDRDAASILRDIKRGLSRLNFLDTTDVTIDVQDQTVLMSGIVPSMAVLRYVVNVAENTLGVRLVKNNLEIRRAGGESSHQKPSSTTPTTPRGDETKPDSTIQKTSQPTVTFKDVTTSHSKD